MAILPGVALSELWQMMRILEGTLRLVAVLVVLASLLGLSAMLLASIREREREIQLLRVIGGSPLFIFLLIELEAILITIVSICLAILVLYFSLLSSDALLTYHFGLYVSTNIFSISSVFYLSLIILATIFAAVIPSLNAYRSAK